MIDATGLVRARERVLPAEYADEDIKLTYMPFFVKACVAALQRHPSFNASIDMEREEIIYRHRCNIGFATATRGRFGGAGDSRCRAAFAARARKPDQ